MGYTHYWRMPFDEIGLDTFRALGNDMRRLITGSNISVSYCDRVDDEWMDFPGPDINDNYILFTPNDNVESFSLDRITERTERDEDDELHFNSCKTNMRKCDKLITAALMLCHYYLKDNFIISSDGWDSDFNAGRELLAQVFPGREFTFKMGE